MSATPVLVSSTSRSSQHATSGVAASVPLTTQKTAKMAVSKSLSPSSVPSTVVVHAVTSPELNTSGVTVHSATAPVMSSGSAFLSRHPTTTHQTDSSGAKPMTLAPAPHTSSVELSSSRRLNLFQTFESKYLKIYPDETCPSMSIFYKDAQLLDNLLLRWTLNSGICFFDLLGFDIYDDWKRQGGTSQDLQRFCGYCKRLSVELLESTRRPSDPRFFSTMQIAFKLFEKKIPPKLQPKFAFLLKVLGQPDQARALGRSSVYLFGQNEVLDGDRSKRTDVIAFLDFASQMHPQEFQFIQKAPSDLALSKDLNAVMKRIDGMMDGIQETEAAETCDRYNLVALLKKIVDQRLLKRTIPVQRFWENIRNMQSRLCSF
jgi:hypothetical protein